MNKSGAERFLAGLFFGVGLISALCVATHVFLVEFNFPQYQYSLNPSAFWGGITTIISFGCSFYFGE